MSLLWSGRNKMKLLTIIKKPSPTYQNNLRDSARNPEKIMDGYQPGSAKAFGFIKGISQFTSVIMRKRNARKLFSNGVFLDASMTLEAAIVLPLVLFFFLNLGCAIEMIRLHSNLQLALWQIGRELSVYEYVVDSGEQPGEEEQENNWWKKLGGIAVGIVYVKNRLIDLAGKEYLENSPLTKGTDSLLLAESEIFGDGDIMDIVVTYSVSPWSKLVGFSSFRMANRYYAHIWNGYELSGETDKNQKEQMVYVTANSAVYHLYRDCTHLQLSVQPVAADEIEGRRNQNGGKYRPCDKCVGDSHTNILYITREGDCFHSDRQCSGLKRTVYSIKITDVEDLRLCSRCEQRK